jgi:hypothetical protein
MAERRMFTKKITESDAFLELPLSSQCLYFHLCMNADDDGFVNNPKRLIKMLGNTEDDMRLLLAKRFLIAFESGVIVVKHWRIHNLLRKDRYKETEYKDEKKRLFLKDNNTYTLDSEQGKSLIESDEKSLKNEVATVWQPNGNRLAPQDSIVKYKEERKEESKDNIYINHAREEETYESIMNDFEVEQSVRPMIWNFIKHCQLNGRTLTNDKLSNILFEMDKQRLDADEKIKALQTAINGGYFDIKRI